MRHDSARAGRYNSAQQTLGPLMLRILHVGKYFAPYHGGVERYMTDLMASSPAVGIECAALVHNLERSWSRQEENHELGDSCATVWRSASWARALFTPLSPGFRKDLSALIKQFKPDAIHVHLPNPSACWLLGLGAARDIPLVVHWHSDVITKDLGFAMRGAYFFYRRIERALLARADAIIATSPSYLRSSLSLADWPDKCKVVPLGLDANRISRLSQPQASSHSKNFRVLAVGRLTYYKGFGFLIRALAEVRDIDLHIVGDGELLEELKALAAQVGVADRVQFLTQVDDEQLAREMATCDCLCLPSIERTEAFGLVLLEAMVFARATVSSAVVGSGMSWVVEDGQTGLTVPPRDVQALAQALRELQADPEKTARLGKAGRARFDEHFSIEHSVRSIKQLYLNILEQPTS